MTNVVNCSLKCTENETKIANQDYFETFLRKSGPKICSERNLSYLCTAFKADGEIAQLVRAHDS